MITLPDLRIAAAITRRLPAAALCLLLSFAAPGVARADEAAQVLELCDHGKLPTGFKQRAYVTALHNMPTVLREYSTCEELIRRAELSATGAQPGAPGGAGSAAGPGGQSASATPLASSPAEQQKLSGASRESAAPVALDNKAIAPGRVNADIASTISDLPNSMLSLVALLIAGALIAGMRRTLLRVSASGQDRAPAGARPGLQNSLRALVRLWRK